MSFFDLMGAPFAECMVLVAIHTYLGIHVLKRRVIFVDLALAQIAALGTTVGFLFGILPETTAALVFSISFAFVGAAVFALTRTRNDKIPQEAIIGLVYAISCATAVLVVEKTQGAEHLKDILVGSILWVTWKDVGTAAVAYLLVGVVHYLFRDKFFAISEDPQKAFANGIRVRAWDFLFYLTFGFTIAFSTRVAGVLLVFVFLVAPAIMAFMVSDRVIYQLLIGWGMGTAVTIGGLCLSYTADLPSGPTVVASYGVALVLGAVCLHVIRANHHWRALGKVVAGTVAALLVVLTIYAEGRMLAGSAIAQSAKVERMAQAAQREKAATPEKKDAAQPGKIKTLGQATGHCVGPGKMRRYAELEDTQQRLEFIEMKIKDDRKRGLGFLLLLLADSEATSFFRGEGFALLKQATSQDFGYDPQLPPEKNATAIKAICGHLSSLKHSKS